MCCCSSNLWHHDHCDNHFHNYPLFTAKWLILFRKLGLWDEREWSSLLESIDGPWEGSWARFIVATSSRRRLFLFFSSLISRARKVSSSSSARFIVAINSCNNQIIILWKYFKSNPNEIAMRNTPVNWSDSWICQICRMNSSMVREPLVRQRSSNCSWRDLVLSKVWKHLWFLLKLPKKSDNQQLSEELKQTADIVDNNQVRMSASCCSHSRIKGLTRSAICCFHCLKFLSLSFTEFRWESFTEIRWENLTWEEGKLWIGESHGYMLKSREN